MPHSLSENKKSPKKIIRPSSQKINLLHLSDIHLGTKADAQLYLSQLTADLKKEQEIERLDYLVLSGDIGNHSLESEYEAATVLVEGILDRFELSDERVILCPGNHDLNWSDSKKAYRPVRNEELPKDWQKRPHRPIDLEYTAVAQIDALQKRFGLFADFYQKVCGRPYPIEYSKQGILKFFEEDQILFLELNSSWEIDHHKDSRQKSSLNMEAFTEALDLITDLGKEWLKIAVFHHPVSGPETMKSIDFMQQLSVHGFQVCMHGHVHEAGQAAFSSFNSFYQINIIGAGSFGVHSKGMVPGIPWQYNFLQIDSNHRNITVSTRKKEKHNGGWTADARWNQPNRPDPFYVVDLADRWEATRAFPRSAKVSDLSSLAELRDLFALDLSFSDIDDLSRISHLNQLEELYVAYTHVSDISTLKNFRNLKIVDLRGNTIKDYSVLQSLPKLEVVYARENTQNETITRLVQDGVKVLHFR